MSVTLLAMAQSFCKERLNAEQFVDAYIEVWKFERDAGIADKDDAVLSECLSSIFCLADLYNPEEDRSDYELDECTLRYEVIKLIDKV
ncbi:colicin immunity protein [Vibrio campbellii]|uniref:Colicin immunity protein n=1 Tax=Vibrio campbellii TaxID=680 RepID=A0AAE9N330_9VIBR|nr:colicin immunity domain-containing protein [Vibrio campbellii]UTZ29660.1 colicin immunity protein [Vibrio campbellii]